MKEAKIKKTLTANEIINYVEQRYDVSYVNQVELDRLIDFISYFKLSEVDTIDCIFSALEECHYFYELAYLLND